MATNKYWPLCDAFIEPPSEEAESFDSGEIRHELDDIKVEYHPNSGRPPEVFSFADFGCQRAEASHVPPKNPWAPFRTKADFEFAEIAFDAAMNEKQVAVLIKLFRRCIEEKDMFTLQGYTDYEAMWNNASKLLTPVRTYQNFHICT